MKKNILIKPTQTTKFKIVTQGAPIVNGGCIIEQGKNIVAIEIDLKSKYCEVDYVFDDDKGVGIAIGTTEQSIKLKKGINRDESTQIILPDFIGWEVFACGMNKYTVKVCLIKERWNKK